MGPTTNTAGVVVKDRSSTGPSPDSATAAGGGTPGGGGSTPGGPASGDLAGTYPGPYVANLQGPSGNGYGIATEKPIGYATGGNIQIRFDLGCYDHIALSVNASFSPAGSSGMKAGSRQTLDLTNASGGGFSATNGAQ